MISVFEILRVYCIARGEDLSAIYLFQMSVALDSIQWQTVYPMDYYANDSLGAWTNNNEAHRPVRHRKSRPVISTKDDKSVLVTDKSVSGTAIGNSGKDKVLNITTSVTLDEKSNCVKETGAGESALLKGDNLVFMKVKSESCCNNSSESRCCLNISDSS